MEVRKVWVVLCLFVVFGCAVGAKKGKSKPENLEDQYGGFVDENIQNDDEDYVTGDAEGPPDEDNAPVAAEEHVEFITQAQVFVANIGDTIRLPCEVSNPDIIMIWQKEEVLLFQAGVPVEKLSNIRGYENNTLEVKLESDKDFGQYACVLMTTNDVKSRPKIIHRIVAPSPPVIHGIYTDKDNKTVYKLGETLTLTCAASGYPKPIISWHKGGERLAATGEKLTIPNLVPSDEGIYRCLADNQLKNQNAKPTHPSHHYIQINIEHVPKVRVGQYLVTSKNEMDAELVCTVDAFPQAKILWKKGDHNVTNDGKNKIKNSRKQNVFESTLLISDLNEEDFATYTCYSWNALGQAEEKINLVKVPVVREFPKPPNPGKEVILTWKVESKSPITAHEIQYRKQGDPEWKVAKPEVQSSGSHINTVTYTLKDLDSGAYETRVRSMSEHGWSEYSDIVPFEGVTAKHGSSTHKNHHKKHHKDPKEKELKEKYFPSLQEATSVPQQQEIVQKEAPVGASKPDSSTSVKSSGVILSIALILLFSIRQ